MISDDSRDATTKGVKSPLCSEAFSGKQGWRYMIREDPPELLKRLDAETRRYAGRGVDRPR